MSFASIWDDTFESKPDNNTYGYEIDDYFRKLYVAIRERMEVDHIWKIGDDDGEHKQITFNAPITTPLAIANKGFLYTKDVSAKAELHYEDEDGNEVQMTDAGGLKVDSAAIITVLKSVYPIGCIYTTIVATNPATVFGFGTWTAFGAGKCLVGLDATQTEFDLVEETGGEKTHTLTEAELAAHDHAIPVYGAAEAYNVGANVAATFQATDRNSTDGTADAGSGTAHNNLQPYIVVYFWKRTA